MEVYANTWVRKNVQERKVEFEALLTLFNVSKGLKNKQQHHLLIFSTDLLL